MGTRDSSSTNAKASAAFSHLLYALSRNYEIQGIHCEYCHPLAFTPLKSTLSTSCDCRHPKDAAITEHILAFNFWLPSDCQSDSYANESTMTGVIKFGWLFRKLMVERDDLIKWPSELQLGGRCVWSEGDKEESWAWQQSLTKKQVFNRWSTLINPI